MKRGTQTVSAAEYRRLAAEHSLGGRIPRRTAANNYIAVGRGFREIGGRQIYFRSRWEANVARYYEWLKSRGELAAWAYEPREDEFWFPIRRGTRSYLPDFKLTSTDGTSVYVEVKGWRDPKSALKLRRMKRYHPHITVVVIGKAEYGRLARQIAGIVPGWEVSA